MPFTCLNRSPVRSAISENHAVFAPAFRAPSMAAGGAGVSRAQLFRVNTHTRIARAAGTRIARYHVRSPSEQQGDLTHDPSTLCLRTLRRGLLCGDGFRAGAVCENVLTSRTGFDEGIHAAEDAVGRSRS